MNFIKRITVLLHVMTMMFLAGFILLFVLQWWIFSIDFETFFIIATGIHSDENLRAAFACLALFLLFENFVFYKVFSVNVRRDKIIAFDNPSGRVSVSLFALEDLIKRLISQQAEVKDARTSITASRKGLSVRIKMALISEENIPEMTSKIQEMVTQKIQDTIGIEEKIDINIYVGKIILGRSKVKQKKKEEEAPEKEENPPNIPFQGYRA